MATVAATIKREWTAAARMHQNWNRCEDWGHEGFETHGDPVIEKMFDRAVASEEIVPGDEEAQDLLGTTRGSLNWYGDGSILLHNDDGCYDEHFTVLRGRARSVAMDLAGFVPGQRPTKTMAERRRERRAVAVPPSAVAVPAVEYGKCELCDQTFKQPPYDPGLGAWVICPDC